MRKWRTLEKFLNGSKNLNAMLGRQGPKHDRSQSSKSKEPSYARVTYDYGMGDSFKVNNAKVVFRPMKVAKNASSRERFINQVGT